MTAETSNHIAAPVSLKEREMHALTLYSLESQGTDPDAPILLFLHGFPDSARVWEPVMAALRRSSPQGRTYSLIAPFVPGTHVAAKIPPERYGLTAWCLDLLSLLQDHDPEQRRAVLIIAHDMGGPFAQALTEYLGSRCLGLIFINSLGLRQYFSRIDKPRQWLKSYYILLFQLKGLPELMLRHLHPFSLTQIYTLGGMDADDPQRRESHQIFAGIEQYRQLFRLAPGLLGKGLTKPSPLPALFIWGEHDPFLEIPSLTEAERFYQKAEVRVLPGKHWILRGQADKIAHHIQKFCEKARSPS